MISTGTGTESIILFSHNSSKSQKTPSPTKIPVEDLSALPKILPFFVTP
jgi:hypothetical protein